MTTLQIYMPERRIIRTEKTFHFPIRPGFEPSIAQKEILNMSSIAPEQRVNDIQLMHRKQLWEKGKVCDIKRGDYLVWCETVSRFDEELHDLGSFDAQYPPFSTAWARGLDRNINMNIKGKEILVMDNHYFAAAFILEMFRRNIIALNSRMMHFDQHADINYPFHIPDNNFDLKVYYELFSDRQRLCYLMDKIDIGSWQLSALIDNNIIDADKWRYYQLEEKKLDWAMWDYGNYLGDQSGQLSIEEKFDIVDIDIDVLHRADRMLSLEQKRKVLEGEIPEKISGKMDDMVKVALDNEVKVITMASSPLYIEQERGIVYIKEILKRLGAN